MTSCPLCSFRVFGLRQFDDIIYQAAEICANRRQAFVRVTLPVFRYYFGHSDGVHAIMTFYMIPDIISR